MKRLSIIVGAFVVGVAAMLGVLQPWKKAPKHSMRIHEEPLSFKPPTAAQQYAQQAKEKISAGELKEAQELLAKAAALDPNLRLVPLYQGDLEMVRGDYGAARRSYTEALKQWPEDPQALSGRAAARFELNEPAGAVEDATAALKAKPTDIDALFTRAAAYGALKRWEECVRDWTAYLAARPKDAHAWTNRGNAHDRMGNKAGAAADWRQAVWLDPSLSAQLDPLIKEAER